MTDTHDGKKTILLVEDEAVIAMAEKRVFQKHGFQVLVASSGIKAIEAAKKTKCIDLILMDIDLGRGMDGIEASEIILREKDIPVVFLSDSTQPEAVEKTDRITSYGYVVKDSPEPVLIASVKMAFRLHDAHRQVKKQEEALRESEENFSKIFNHSSNCVAITRTAEGRFIDVNDAWMRAFGYTREEAVGKLDVELMMWKHPADRDKCTAELAEKGEVLNLEAVLMQASEEATYLMSGKSVEIDGEECILWELRDITGRKTAEEKLHTSRLQLAEAADLAKIAYWEHEESTGEYIFNDAFYALYGTTAEQEGGYRMPREEYLRRFVHPDEMEASRLRFKENRVRPRPGDLRQSEHRVIRRDGEVIQILTRNRLVTDSEGRVLRAVGVNQDITARKKMEDALREYENMIEGSPDMVTVVDREYRYRVANSVFLKYRGLKREEVIGRAVPEVLDRDVFERTIKKNLDRCFQGESVQYDMNYAYPGLGERDLLISYLPIQGPGGIDRVTSIIRDVTEGKRTEEALRKSEQRYRALFETVRDGFASADMDKRIIEANPAFQSMVGYTEEELFNLTYVDLTPEKWHAFEEKIVQAQVLTRGYSDVYVKEYIRKDGTVFPAEVRVHLLRDEEGRPGGMWAFVRDVTERVHVEEALRQSEERFATAFRASPICASLTRLADGKFLDVNDAFLRFFGCQRGEVMGSDPLSLNMWAHAEDRASMVDALRERGRVPGFETTFRTKTGEIRDVLVVAELVDVAQERYVLGLTLDITERKQTLEALRESETKLRAILDGSRDPIGVSKDGIHTFVNPAYASLFGYESADDLMGTGVIDLIAPESRGFVAGAVKKRARGEPAPTFYEVTALKKDGTTFLMEVTISSYVLKGERFILVILRDVTDRRRAEDEIRMLKHSIDVYYDGAYWMNTDNRFVYVNDAACKALGYAREELIGETLYQINPTATAEGIKKVWEELRKGGSFLGESVHRRKDGSEFPVEVVITYVQFRGSEFACAFARDITEKKRLEDQLRQAQKMEAIGTLAGGVAHDFNNILTVIMSFGNLIQMGIDKDDLLRPYIDQIVVSSERAADLTQSLLAFSRKQHITQEPHTVNGVVASTAKLLKRLLPEDIELNTNLTDKETLTMLDVTQVGQVIMNLATNARDAMPHGGLLTIATEVARLDNQFAKAHGFGRPGNYVKLSVSDTGIGIDEGTMKRIFEPFFTTKEVGKGTGLGLASAYGIVKQHGGYITVSSGLSKGTTFDLYLPLIDAPRPRGASGAEEIKKGTETILIVEDDRDVRNMMAIILKNQGYVTIEATDGDDAIKLYEEHKGKVDLVILDVVMPGKNGKQVLDEITRVNPSVKAVFVSGYTGDIVIDKGIESESVDFLQKPLSVAKLLSKVREVLDR